MTDPRAAIGVLGGTFDPVHLGHLRVAVELGESLALDEVHLVPNSVPPHRPEPLADVELRADWIEQSIVGQPRLVLDRRELQRDGPSYTVDTLAGMRDENPDRRLVLILGHDAFAGFSDWHRVAEFPHLAHLVVVPRPGGGAPRSEPPPGFERAASAADLRRVACGLFMVAEVTPLAISSTDIRRRLAAGLSIRYLVPGVVHRAIAQQMSQLDLS